MNLTSGIAKRYRQSFVLDEDSLRRLHGLLEKASKQLSVPSQVVFHVEREDDRFYETTDIDEVLIDPNIYGKRVTLVVLEIRPESRTRGDHPSNFDWQVMVAYSKREMVGPFPEGDTARIRIATDDKNWALLLADELEPQVMRTLRARRTPRWLIALAAAPIVFLCWRLLIWFASALGDVPSSAESLALAAVMLTALLALGTLGSVLFFRGGSRGLFVRLFGPESTFLWGEEAQSYQYRQQTRQSVQWGVLVAFLVSLAAGAYVAYITWMGTGLSSTAM